MLQRIKLGFKRHWKDTFGWGFAALGAVYTLEKIASAIFPVVSTFVESHQRESIGVLALAAIINVARRLPEPLELTIKLKHTQTEITIKSGDIFSVDGAICIPVNEFFDSELGDIVSPNSVHGQFIAKMYSSNTKRFEEEIDKLLLTKVSEQVPRTNSQRCLLYRIGTTVSKDFGSKKALLFALCKTDPATDKASANVGTMWNALQCLWIEARNRVNGSPVYIPLVGSGQSGVGLEPVHLLHLIMLSILVATQERKVADKFIIMLTERDFGQINLRAIKQEWE